MRIVLRIPKYRVIVFVEVCIFFVGWKYVDGSHSKYSNSLNTHNKCTSQVGLVNIRSLYIVILWHTTFACISLNLNKFYIFVFKFCFFTLKSSKSTYI